MSDLDLAELERLAKAADCWGRWAIWPDLKEGGFVHVGNADGVIPEGEIATPENAEPNPIAKCYTPEIAEFIAATDPATVLALIERLREAEARIEKVRKMHKPVDIEPSDTICAECSFRLPNGRYFGKVTEWPCETVKALTEGDEQ